MAPQTKFAPKVEIFSPFRRPFSDEEETYITVVSPYVVEYMKSRKCKIVAKCTPCQCCACR